MPDNSEIIVHKGGTMFAGPDAVHYFRVATLMSSMGIFKAGMKFRNCSGAQALKQATAITGKTYKRGQYDQAHADLKVWLDVARSSLPVTVEE